MGEEGHPEASGHGSSKEESEPRTKRISAPGKFAGLRVHAPSLCGDAP